MIRVTVIGACGRMAGQVTKLISEAKDMKLVGLLEHKSHPQIGSIIHGCKLSSDFQEIIPQSDVFVEFTSPKALDEVLDNLSASGAPLISGTTGLSEQQFAKLKVESAKRALLWSPNMSVGVNMLFKLTADAANALETYDTEIVEIHHRHKQDAPSGTALRLANIIKANRNISKTIYGRQGHTGERKSDEMAILALRGGDVAGEHTVYFLTEGERLELTHRASSRLAFAKGSLLAIRFIVNKQPGFYQFRDILEDK